MMAVVIAVAATACDDNDADSKTAKAADAAVEQRVAALEASVTALQEQVQTLTASAAARAGTDAALDARITNTESQLAALQASDAARATAIVAAAQQVDGLLSRTSALEAGALDVVDGADRIIGPFIDNPLVFVDAGTGDVAQAIDALYVLYDGLDCTGNAYVAFATLPAISNVALFDSATGTYYRRLDPTNDAPSAAQSYRTWGMLTGSAEPCANFGPAVAATRVGDIISPIGQVAPYTPGVHVTTRPR